MVAKRSLEEILRDAAEDFDAFYAQRAPAPWQQTADILVAAVDGKGIPMIRQRASRVPFGHQKD